MNIKKKNNNLANIKNRKLLILIIIAVSMILIFHEIIPKPFTYLADFLGGMILGLYWFKDEIDIYFNISIRLNRND